jgi:hypothetical protein
VRLTFDGLPPGREAVQAKSIDSGDDGDEEVRIVAKTYQDFEEADALSLLPGLDPSAKRALDYFRGDHWQNRSGWAGPVPKGDNAANDWEEIRRCFVSKNVVKEGVERHTFGVLGREPMWSFDPLRKRRLNGQLGDNSTDADRADGVLLPWWDEKRMLLRLRLAAESLLITKSGALRLMVSPVKVRGSQIGRVSFTVAEPGQACVYRDPLTEREIGIFSYRGTTGESVTEVSFLKDDGRTVIRTLAKTDPATVIGSLLSFVGLRPEQVVTEVTIDLGGRLHVFEMRREALITESVLQNQGLLNLALTMLPRNVVMGGFLERVFLNAQRPKKRDSQGNETGEDGDYEAGAGAASFVRGITYEDEQGNTKITQPSINWREPVSVKTFEDTIRIAYETMLDEMHQKHVVENGSQDVGAEARKQARDDYEKSLLMTKGEIDALGRWALEVALRVTDYLEGEAFDSRIDVGPLNSEEVRMMQADVEKGRMSRQTYMNRRGIDDPDAELSMIASDTSLATQLERFTVVAQARVAGLNLEESLKIAGFAPEAITRLLAGAAPDVQPPAVGNEGQGALVA